MHKLMLTIAIFLSTLTSSTITFSQPDPDKVTYVFNSANSPPYNTKEGNGFLDIYVSTAFQRIGASLKIVNLPAERGLLNANNGIIDGELNRIKGLEKEYENLIMIPELIRQADFCALSKNPSLSSAKTDLHNVSVGHVKGWKIFEKMMKGSDNVTTTGNEEQLFRLLNLDRIEIALFTCAEGIALARKIGMDKLHILKPNFPKIDLYLYINKKHAHITKKLNKALHDLKTEGLYDRLYREKVIPYLQ